MDTKILITGGSGFIGTNLIGFYLSKGFHVLNIDIKSPRSTDQNLYWKNADIRDYDSFKQLVSDFNPDYVLHMAAKADLAGKTLQDYSSNTLGVTNVLKICNEVASVRKVIFASTQLVCQVGYLPITDNDYCPPNLYGESKMIGEKLVKNASSDLKFKWVIIRPTSIWGPWFGPTYRRFFEMIMKRQYFNFTGKMSTKTYGYVGNSVYQINELLKSDSTQGKTFYIGDYSPVRIKEWADEIAQEMNFKLVIVPRWIIWCASILGDILAHFKVKFPMNSFRYKNMTTDNIAHLEEIYKIAPNTPYSRLEGNRLTIKWMTDCYFNK